MTGITIGADESLFVLHPVDGFDIGCAFIAPMSYTLESIHAEFCAQWNAAYAGHVAMADDGTEINIQPALADFAAWVENVKGFRVVTPSEAASLWAFSMPDGIA